MYQIYPPAIRGSQMTKNNTHETLEKQPCRVMMLRATVKYNANTFKK